MKVYVAEAEFLCVVLHYMDAVAALYSQPLLSLMNAVSVLNSFTNAFHIISSLNSLPSAADIKIERTRIMCLYWRMCLCRTKLAIPVLNI